MSRYHLAHIIPDPRIHGFKGFQEVIDTVGWGLEQLGHRVTRAGNSFAKDAINIVFGAQMLPVRVGRETMLGKTVSAIRRIDSQTGKVFVEGEYWNALSDSPIEAGQTAQIVGIEGLTLKVKPA